MIKGVEVYSRFLYLKLLLLFLLIFNYPGYSQLSHQGNAYTEFDIDRKHDERYFENWTSFSLSYQNWRVGVQYELHLPPVPYSLDTVGQGIYQRFIEYQNERLHTRVGNFYTIPRVVLGVLLFLPLSGHEEKMNI